MGRVFYFDVRDGEVVFIFNFLKFFWRGLLKFVFYERIFSLEMGSELFKVI